MKITRVKICGIKRREDLDICLASGADAVGFLVGQKHNSEDFISAELAREMIVSLPPFISSVLVTHLEDKQEIVDLAKKILVNTIQLHGNSSPEDTSFIREKLPNIKLYKSIHVEGEETLKEVEKWDNCVDAIILDTAIKSEGKVGGTGKVHNWDVSEMIVQKSNVPVILAGGLNPENVRSAIEKVKPFAVDVNSGTKGDDGYKDTNKVINFIKNAKNIS